MFRKRNVRIVLSLLAIGFVGALSIAVYMFNKPHRDIQSSAIDYELEARDLVNQYLANPDDANQKYLDETGDSKILGVTGRVRSITRDLNSQFVILLQDDGEKAGVSCTFTTATNASAERLSVGQSVKVKGVIRTGAGYDADLELYEDVILEKCDIIKQ